MAEMYVQGVSTRKVKAITEELCGHEFSSATVSRVNENLDGELAKFAAGVPESGSGLSQLQPRDRRGPRREDGRPSLKATNPDLRAFLDRGGHSLLAIIRKRRVLDCGRGGSVDNIAELETQVLEIAAGSRMFHEFLNDGLEVG